MGAAAGAGSLIWGTSFILMKKGLVVFSALELGAARVSVAALLLLPFAVRDVGAWSAAGFKWLALSGTVGTLIPAFLVCLRRNAAGLGAGGRAQCPHGGVRAAGGALLFGQRLTGLRVLGIGLGLLGTVVLMLLGGSAGGSLRPPATSAAPGTAATSWLATIGYGLSVNVIKHRLHGLTPVAVTSLLLLLIGGPALAYLLLGTGFVHKLATVPGAWAAFRLHRAAGHHEHGRGHGAVQHAHSAAPPRCLPRPAPTSFPSWRWAWGALDGEAFNLWHAAGMAIILAGVFIIHRAR
ncbi:MAG: EamA family transporter [Hymenobacter sp.]